MTIWKLQYIESDKSVVPVQFEVPALSSDIPLPKTNIVDEDSACFLEEMYAVCEARHEMEMIEDNAGEYIKCKDCGRFFWLGMGEKDWMKSRGIFPKYCAPCRKKRKKLITTNF